MHIMHDALTKTYYYGDGYDYTTDAKLTAALDPMCGVRRYVDAGELKQFDTSTKTHYGDAEFILVKNTEASDWTIGDVITRTATLVKGYYGTSAGTSSTKFQVLGVARHVIPAGHWGWVQCRGVCLVKGETAGITADTDIMQSAGDAGTAEDFAVGGEHRVFGHSLEAAAAVLATLFLAYVEA